MQFFIVLSKMNIYDHSYAAFFFLLNANYKFHQTYTHAHVPPFEFISQSRWISVIISQSRSISRLAHSQSQVRELALLRELCIPSSKRLISLAGKCFQAREAAFKGFSIRATMLYYSV